MKKLGFVLAGLFVAACTSSSGTSSTGQMITCQTDPNTGVITRCEPGDGSGSGSCHDIDEDGDGDPHDSTDSGSHDSFAAPDGGSDDGSGSDDHGGGTEGDSDGDGIPDSDDCDNHHGEDDDAGDELPYDVRPALGATTQPIQEAFAAKGGQPAQIDSITMDGGTWRLTELQAGTAFLVTEDDCNHVGNRDVGRDRVVVTWEDTVGGVSQSDHLDIRYCKN
ncbi:MAG: hypothetical protein QM831_46655 [Kofleriaceae bacterium]